MGGWVGDWWVGRLVTGGWVGGDWWVGGLVTGGWVGGWVW